MRAILLIILVLLIPTLYAAPSTYPSRPPNNVSLYYQQPAPKLVKHRHHRHHRHHRRRPLITTQHKHPHKIICRHKKPGASGLYVYYALPATACCGAAETLRHARCCAHSGEWGTSYYGTFKPSADDMYFNATNEDEYARGWDDYASIVAEDYYDPDDP